MLSTACHGRALTRLCVAAQFGAKADFRNMTEEQRDPWYKFVFNAVQQAQSLGAPLQVGLQDGCYI